MLGTLQRLNKQLEEVELGQFRPFNQAYWVVTDNIRQAIQDDYFTNPEFIEKFVVAFADHYFQAINKTLAKDSSLPTPWAKLNEYASDTSAPIFIGLMLGANAHINHDLPQVLRELMEGEKTDDLLADVIIIDKLLMKSGQEIPRILKERNNFLDFLRRHFQFLYYRPAMHTILVWRINAWKSYKQLSKDEAMMVDIRQSSVRIANRILRIGHVL